MSEGTGAEVAAAYTAQAPTLAQVLAGLGDAAGKSPRQAAAEVRAQRTPMAEFIEDGLGFELTTAQLTMVHRMENELLTQGEEARRIEEQSERQDETAIAALYGRSRGRSSMSKPHDEPRKLGMLRAFTEDRPAMMGDLHFFTCDALAHGMGYDATITVETDERGQIMRLRATYITG